MKDLCRPIDQNIRPLTPDVLKRMRAVQPVADVSMRDKQGTTTQSYRIWQSVGGGGRSDNDQSRVIGSLTMTRSPEEGGLFSLRVRQQVLMIDNPDIKYGGVHEIVGDLDCAADGCATPQRWRVEHRIHRHRKRLEALPLVYEGRFEDGALHQTINGRPRQTPIAEAWTADWCLIEAIPRLLIQGDADRSLIVLDRMRDVLPDQRLRPRLEADYVSPHFGPLRCVAQTGHGTLPTDYWINEAGELLFVTSVHQAYIADDRAEAKIQRILDENFIMRFEEQGATSP